MTPYDTALRIQRREVDTVKVSISVEVERIVVLDGQIAAHDTRLRDERALAHAMPFASDAWTARMKHERIRLDDAARMARARLGQLRAQAIEAYGTMRAIESAADRYRDEADRVADAAEQASIDDIAAARLLRERRRAARRMA